MVFRYISQKYMSSMPNTSRIKVITFDAYNTLFKPKGSLSAQYVEEGAKYGIHVTRDQINQHFGQAYRKQLLKAPFYGIDQGMTPKIWWKELVYATFIGCGISSKDIDSNFNELFDSLYSRFTTAEAYSIFPDVLGTLKELKHHGFTMGVISNSDERVVKVIENLKLSQYFDFVLASSLAGHEKPDKCIFEQALAMVGNISPEDTLHIGDDVNKDYFGSLNSGMNAVLLERRKLSYEDFSPTMLGDSSIPIHRPRQISSLHDLYPYINTMHANSSSSSSSNYEQEEHSTMNASN